jgi:hypothetical protein
VDPTTEFLGNLGLGMLFFFAGYEHLDARLPADRPAAAA